MMKDRNINIKRLKYRSWHRGCKETDVILGNFSDKYLQNLSDAELDIYAEFIEEQDSLIWKWIVGQEIPARADYKKIIKML